jgi:hypothetical protein
MIVLLALVGVTLLMPVSAQTPPIFATNTPAPASPTPLPGPILPDGRIDQYALRLWLEKDLINVALSYIAQLTPGDERGWRAVQLVLFELETRFPGAPHQSDQREALIQAMVSAPRGSIDMRHILRPYIEAALNRQGTEESLANYHGFKIDVILMNLDGAAPVDALIHTQYPADAATPADLLYEDYVLAQVDSSGAYHLLDANPDFPAAPYGDVQTIGLERFGDLNGDTLEEMALTLRRGTMNEELLIFGWRNDSFIGLIEPGERLEFGQIRDWTRDSVQVYHYRAESPAWGCLSEIPLEWRYNANFFRRVIDPLSNVGYEHQNTLACRLYEAEPFFSEPPADAIAAIERILSQSSRDEPGSQYAYERAQMTLAMLYAVDGQPSAAMDIINALQPEADSWLQGQVDAFVTTFSRAGATAVDLCAALLQADLYGACNIDEVLGRAFEANPLSRSRPLGEQLQERGLPVLETVNLSQIGRLDRVAVNFNLFGASWWAFAPLQPDVYSAERIDPPGRFQSATLPLGFVDAPDAAYEALFVDHSAARALTLIDNAARDNPDVPLSPAARYLQALCYDLTADRQPARNAYFNLWSEYFDTLWGQLAAVHLERR